MWVMIAKLERLGARVSWDSRTRAVTVTKGTDVLRLTVGQTTATIRGNNITLDAAPLLVDGRVLVPLRRSPVVWAGYVVVSVGYLALYGRLTAAVPVAVGRVLALINCPDKEKP